MIHFAGAADWSLCGRMVLLPKNCVSFLPLSGKMLITLERRMFAEANKCRVPHSFADFMKLKILP